MEPRVVITHDYLTQRGGAERVVLAMLEAFPGARLVTSTYDPETTFPEFQRYEVETLWPDRIPALRRDPRKALPVLPQSFSAFDTSDADVVIASSSGWAHGLGGPDVPKIVYCHNPARWLYQKHDYAAELSRGSAAVLGLLGPALRAWDRRAAWGATRYLANSTSVQRRIDEVYGIRSTVLHPPSSLDPAGPQEPVEGLEPGFLLTVARKRGYKHVDVVCEAVATLPEARLVVVGGLPADREWPDNLRGVQDVPDEQLRWLYANAAGLVAVSHEDFGLTPVEGYMFGLPSVLLRAGGYLDSSVELLTTLFIDDVTVEGLREAVLLLLEAEWDHDAIRAHAERFSPATFRRRLRGVVADVLAEAGAGGVAGPPAAPFRLPAGVARHGRDGGTRQA